MTVIEGKKGPCLPPAGAIKSTNIYHYHGNFPPCCNSAGPDISSPVRPSAEDYDELFYYKTSTQLYLHIILK